MLHIKLVKSKLHKQIHRRRRSISLNLWNSSKRKVNAVKRWIFLQPSSAVIHTSSQ